MITAEELQRLLSCMAPTGGHTDRNGNYIQMALECNFCSQGDYMFAEHFASTDFEGVAEHLLAHLAKYHPERMQVPVEPVTDEEIAEVFGLSQRSTKTKR